MAARSKIPPIMGPEIQAKLGEDERGVGLGLGEGSDVAVVVGPAVDTVRLSVLSVSRNKYDVRVPVTHPTKDRGSLSRRLLK